MPRTLTHIYQHRLTSLKEVFTATLKDPEQEAIHQLRVNIKKIKALLRLMQEMDPQDRREKAFRALFADVFKQAGRVREIQINRELLKAYREGSGLITSLAQMEKQETKVLLQVLKTFSWDQVAKDHQQQLEKLKHLDEDSVYKLARSRAFRELSKVISLKYQPGPQQLHQVRIKLKAIVEVLAVMVEIHPQQSCKQLLMDIKVLNQIIGEWHDYQVLEDSLLSLTQYSNIKHSDVNTLAQAVYRQVRQKRSLIRKQLHETINRETIRELKP